jgi:hypothetical protein
MRRIGLAWNVVEIPPERQRQKEIARGDASLSPRASALAE